MEKYRISIIVPVYQAEAYLERCVDSLTGQTFENMEIILVDDGSYDRSPLMCDRYASKDGRIRVLHKENGGLVSAWKAGVGESRGEYLCFVDSDDWVEKDMLAGMAACLSGTGREIVCCNFLISRPGRVTAHYHGLPPGTYEGGGLEEIRDRLLGNENRTVSMSRCMKLFARRLIEENMVLCNPRITMAEDVNITLPALLDCERLVIMEGALYYHYFYNSESMVHKYDARMYEGIRVLYRTILRVFEEKGRKDGKIQADREYVYLLFLAVKNEIRGGGKGFAGRVRQICLNEENRRIVEACPVEVKDRANRLIYFGVRHPAGIVLLLLRLLFRLYDGRGISG